MRPSSTRRCGSKCRASSPRLRESGPSVPGSEPLATPCCGEILYDAQGEKLYPTYTRKQGRQYRYYISRNGQRYGSASKPCLRLPAEELETATVAQIKTVLSSPEAIAAVCQRLGTVVDEASTVLALSSLGSVWEQLYPVEQQRIVHLMIERIDWVANGLQIHWRELGWQALIREFTPATIGAELVALEDAA
jgi:site-specific DNA recombinase